MTDKWIKDTGLVFALVFLVLGYVKESQDLLVVSGVLLFISIFIPQAIYPVALLWQKIAELLGLIVPKIFFGIVFFAIILPIGFLRRFLKGDMLFILKWREAETVFKERNHLFVKQDVEQPY
ncbi:MAG: hypothetical protein HYT94_04065 [Parcubacteria group bacterium]|nr:hypothetical protein [Parcubacteria group bacterium]